MLARWPLSSTYPRQRGYVQRSLDDGLEVKQTSPGHLTCLDGASWNRKRRATQRTRERQSKPDRNSNPRGGERRRRGIENRVHRESEPTDQKVAFPRLQPTGFESGQLELPGWNVPRAIP